MNDRVSIPLAKIRRARPTPKGRSVDAIARQKEIARQGRRARLEDILSIPVAKHANWSDADITAVNLERQQAVLGVSGGRVIMHRGYACGSGSRIVTTAAGAAAVRARGLAPLVVDLTASTFYAR